MIAETRPRPAAMGASQLRREFWASFRDEMKDVGDIGCSRASSDGWMWHTASLSAGYLASLVNVREREICVWFRLNDANADTVYSFLGEHRDRVDREFVTPPRWRRGGGRSHVIEQRRRADVRDRDAWPEHMTWLREQLQDFQRALWPLVGRVPPLGERRRWDEDLFFGELGAWNPDCLAPARAVLDWAHERGEEVQWGSGGQCGSFTPVIMRRGVPHRLVSVSTDGTLRLLFSRLKESSVFAERDQRVEVLTRVNEVRHVRLSDKTLRQRPALPLALLTDSVAAGQFTRLLDWFRETVRST